MNTKKRGEIDELIAKEKDAEKRLEKKIRKPKREYRFVDWWSLPHFSLGFIFGMIALSFSMSLKTGLMATFLIAFFWEFPIEPLLFKIFDKEFHEKVPNQISDIIFDTSGFLIMFFIESFYIGAAIVIVLMGMFLFYPKGKK